MYEFWNESLIVAYKWKISNGETCKWNLHICVVLIWCVYVLCLCFFLCLRYTEVQRKSCVCDDDDYDVGDDILSCCCTHTHTKLATENNAKPTAITYESNVFNDASEIFTDFFSLLVDGSCYNLFIQSESEKKIEVRSHCRNAVQAYDSFICKQHFFFAFCYRSLPLNWIQSN